MFGLTERKRRDSLNLFHGLIPSKLRVSLLMRLFLNPEHEVYLRQLARELDTAPSQLHEELKQLSEAGLLDNRASGRQTFYRANQQHPLFPELRSMVQKSLGMDRILDSILVRLGDLQQAILLDDYAQGRDSGLIDLVLIGHIDHAHLNDLVTKTERYINRKIRTLTLTLEEYEALKPTLAARPQVVLWSIDQAKSHSGEAA